jgi:soluble lytic murein transglycosylase
MPHRPLLTSKKAVRMAANSPFEPTKGSYFTLNCQLSTGKNSRPPALFKRFFALQWSCLGFKPSKGFRVAAHKTQLPLLALASVAGLWLPAGAQIPPPAVPDAAPAVAPVVPQRPLLPKPAAPSKAEIEHFERLDKVTGPIRNYDISAADATLVRDSVAAVNAANRSKAADLQAQIKDPAGSKLAYWYRLKSGYGTPAEYRDFLTANPTWPERGLLTQRLEEALFTQGGSASAIKAQFKDQPPQTGIGKAALASALQAEGNVAEATRLAAQAWREDSIPATLETGFLERFRSLLKPADHKWRLDRLIIDDLRYAAERKPRAEYARRTIALLPAADQKAANARLAVFTQSSGAKALIDAIPAPVEADWGLVFHRVQALRRAGKRDEAAKLLLSAPTEAAKTVVPDSWWEERRANAYAAMTAGKYQLAYDLVRDCGPLTVNPLKEQQFLAGWLALRMLKDPKRAEPHFLALKKAADGPLSRAKANYWLGRTAEVTSSGRAAADPFYREAALDTDTFHGMLARQKLEPTNTAIKIAAPAPPTSAEIERFMSLDTVKAVVAGRKAGLDREIMRSFLVQLRNVFEGEAGSALVAHLAEAIGDTQMAVRTGKAAISARQNMFYYAYPVHSFPAYTPLRKPPETAFLLGIARQETEFNNLTVSGAGAKGLLQVMTVTAEHVCRDYKIKCDVKRLLTDTSYNTMMASAYTADRMDEFRGSYILALAGYNAGPGRARQWIRELGDPRDADADPIDWIERIPIQETREYVAKVLANIQIYRARLGEEATALRLEDDLRRAKAGAKAASKSDG